MDFLNRQTYADSAIIMSIYNRDKPFYLYCSLWSLVNQSEDSFMIFIYVDGNISHSLRKVIYYYCDKYENITVFYRDENKGLAHALNYIIDYILLNHPEIEYYFRMDADDINVLDRIKKQKEFLMQDTNYSIDVLGGSCMEFGLHNKKIVRYENDAIIKKKIIRTTPFIHPTVAFRKRVFSDGNRYPESTLLTEDLALWLLLAKNNYIFHNLDDVLLFYRLTTATVFRRIGFRKAYCELMLRMDYIIISQDNKLPDIAFSLCYFFIKILPVKIVSFLYKILRDNKRL